MPLSGDLLWVNETTSTYSPIIDTKFLSKVLAIVFKTTLDLKTNHFIYANALKCVFSLRRILGGERNRSDRFGQMGYMTNMFISRVDHNLICGICTGVFKRPVVTHCGHTYCEECIKLWVTDACVKEEKTCPECRQEVSLSGTSPVLALRGVIEGLSVECQNSSNGCQMVLRLGDMESHLKNCGYALVKCCSCLEMISQIQLRQHQSKCKVGHKSSFDSHLKKEIAVLQNELAKTKKSLQMAEETIKKLQRNLRDLRVKTRIKPIRANEELQLAWDSDYGYGYSPRSVIELASFISRFLFERPPFVDPQRIFTCLTRCYDYYRNSAAFWQDVHMLLATAAASDWFTDQQREVLISWLKNLAREKLLLI